jgi:hypothetical protein
MTSPTQEDEEVKYRFSRPVRLWAVGIGLAVSIAGTVLCLVLRAWEGVVGGILGVSLGVQLMAQQLGVRARLPIRFAHGPLPQFLVSVAVLALVMTLVALHSRDIVPVVAVGGVLFTLLLIQFWWEKHRSQERGFPQR